MIVYFEGLSCAGKTTLIDYINSNTDNKVQVIKELPVDYSKIKDIDNFCRKNDEIKSKEAFIRSKKNTVLVDRGYASTLAYNYIQYKTGISKEYLKSLKWYFNCILANKLIKPDLYVYIDIETKEVKKRAMRLNKFNNNIAWYTKPLIATKFYDMFFKYFEPEIPILKLKASIPTKVQAQKFWEKVNKINNNV